VWLNKLTRPAATKVKNWASTHFVNMREVFVSETPEQIGFNYVPNDYFVKARATTYPQDWYARMAVSLKDNKIKTSFYDDRNTQVGFFNMPALHYKFDNYFGKQGIAKKHYIDGMVNIRPSYITTTNKLLGSSKLNEAEKYQNDWEVFKQSIIKPRLAIRFNF
jgi:hypothetical protein